MSTSANSPGAVTAAATLPMTELALMMERPSAQIVATTGKFADPPQRRTRVAARAGKRGLDVGVAAAGLMLLLPVLLLIAALIWLQDGKTPIFRHQRLGRHGRSFDCFKFRSMIADAESVLARHLAADPAARMEWERTHKLTNDPRITALGRILRKTSLDELPQLINVLCGQMSLVGPRPIVDAERERYGASFPVCFSVPPGITGLWQVSGRSDTTYSERVALDIQYAYNWSFREDLSILMRTVPAVLNQRGSR